MCTRIVIQVGNNLITNSVVVSQIAYSLAVKAIMALFWTFDHVKEIKSLNYHFGWLIGWVIQYFENK